MRNLLFVILFLLPVSLVEAQIRPGVSFQLYPAGQVLQLRGVVKNTEQMDVRLYAGVNRARRQDFGKKDNEEGFGAGLGLDAIRTPVASGIYYGGKLDLWYLTIDWEHVENRCPEGAVCLVPPTHTSGKTNLFVVQPTATLGYRYLPSNSDIGLEFSLSLGAEINAHTDGDKVGEGLILLGGIAIDF